MRSGGRCRLEECGSGACGIKSRVARRVGRHRLHQLRNLAVDLEPSRGDFLQLVGTAREPAIYGHACVRSQEINFQVIARPDEPQVFVGNAARKIELVRRARCRVGKDCRLAGGLRGEINVATAPAVIPVSAGDRFRS